MADNEKLVKDGIKRAAEEAQRDQKNRKAQAEFEAAQDKEKAADEAAEASTEDAEGSVEEEKTEALDAEAVEELDGKKKGIFKKKDKKDKRDEQIAELQDKVVRQMAEFENFRKRTEKEKSQMFEVGAKSIIEKVLPVIDTFELGFKTLTDEQKEDPFVLGMEKTYKLMMDGLAAAGVTPIEAVGKEFNPDLHNAVMHEDNEELGENIVSQELQKGYMYHDSVVRFSMVKVAN